MRTEKWLTEHAGELRGKRVAITGSTGGLGRELCAYLAALGASLILLDRNAERSRVHAEELRARFAVEVACVTLDLESLASANAALEELESLPPDVLIQNAGAYAIARHPCESGYDTVFQTNFATPYYLIRRLLPMLRARNGRIVIVGSIAHALSRIDPSDVDFSTRRSDMRVYGNSKRWLILATEDLIVQETGVTLAVTHPGITSTNITSHYPTLVHRLVKPPMRLIFPSPRNAARSVLWGVFEETEHGEWLGPRVLGVWGRPQKKKRPSVDTNEREAIAKIADEVFARCLQCSHTTEKQNGR